MIHRPDRKVECASQLPAPVTGDLSQPLREAKPASSSRRVPSFSAVSIGPAIAGSSIATRP
ncbi:hypothetical protein SHKM778_39640 [Streptomyces sp. KM77-8]|uniref:Uncharacterized protein n=1 Tax=Streptomyces haneummycinicus TaxID=3074435 RepID=A0AAT9HJH2_9ACTN